MVEILTYSIFESSSSEIILINNEIIAEIRTILFLQNFSDFPFDSEKKNIEENYCVKV